jgi:ribonucleotide monophosphatase NagD (HAD superfamily)
VLIGTNCDHRLGVGRGIVVPDALLNIFVLQAAPGRTATVLGKPSKLMFEPLRISKNLDKDETIMVVTV